MEYFNKKLLNYFNTKTLSRIILIGIVIAATPVHAMVYQPGQTLNPNCLPTDANCYVSPPLTLSGATTTVTSSAASFTATSTTASTLPYASTTALSVSGGNATTSALTLGSVNGILRAVAGVVQSTYVSLSSDITGVLGVLHGGTGISTAPSYGKVLLGNASGGYNLVATSSLGIVGGSASATTPGGSSNQIQFNSNGAFAGSSSLTFNSNTLSVQGTASSTNLAVSNNANVKGSISAASAAVSATTTTQGISATFANLITSTITNLTSSIAKLASATITNLTGTNATLYTASVGTLTATSSLSAGSTTLGNTTITGSNTLTVGTGLTSIGGNATIAGTLNVTGTTTLNNLAMNSTRITDLATPTGINDATNKAYVDAIAQGISWQPPVVALATTSAPASPTTGDRYVILSGASGFGTCALNQIAQYSGSAWVCSTPSTGWSVYINQVATNYNFNGTSWVSLGSTINHNNLFGLQGGQAGQFYHINKTNYDEITNSKAQLASLLSTGAPSFAGLTITGSSTRADSLNVVGKTTITGDASVSATTTTQGLSATFANLITSTITNLTSSIAKLASATITNLTGTNATLYTASVGTLTATSSLSVNGQTTLTNASSTNQTVSGYLNVGGHTTLATASSTDLSLSGYLNVSGQTTLANASTSAFTVSGNQWITPLATPMGTFLAVNAQGKVIATTTPAGGTGGVGIGTKGQLAFYNANGTNLTATSSIFLGQSGTFTASAIAAVNSLSVGKKTTSTTVYTPTGTLNSKVNYTTGSYPRSVAIGDLNGDGKPDLAVANSGSATVSVFLNNGSGTFATKVDYTTGVDPESVAIGDLNGDGKPDLAVANVNSNTVSVFLNAGNGTFATKVDYTTGVNPGSVAIGDLNGDGKPDLAVANSGSATVSVFLNNGSGTFATKVDYGTGTDPTSVAIADLNGDGNPDLAVANYGSATVSVFLNAGNGTFATKVDYTTGVNPGSVAIGDLNGDGKPDLAVANSGSATVSVFLNNGSGTFATKVDYGTGANPDSVAIGDLNGDGKPDLAVTNFVFSTVSVFLNNGSGTFATKVDYGTGTDPTFVAIGDLNGDGTPDLAVANYFSNSASVLTNIGINPVTTTTTSAALTVDGTTGNVGIGTTTPSAKLTVQGAIAIASTTPSSTSNALYNKSGTLYWNGSLVGIAVSGTEGQTITMNSSGSQVATSTIFLAPSGNVGIGTTTPTQKLDVVGNINISNGSTLKVNGADYAINNLADAQNDAVNNNLFLGGAGFSGIFYNNYNTAIGRYAFDNPNTDNTQTLYGNKNTAVGYNALTSNTTGSSNSAQGSSALYSNTTGSNNSAQGSSALTSNTTGSNNSAQGSSALTSNTTGSNNSAQGANALYSNTTGSYNSAQGSNALYSNTTGFSNSAQGSSALTSNTTGFFNSAQGSSALKYNTTGSSNAAQGALALYANTTGSSNAAQGINALSYNTTGSNNSAQGANALYSNTTGSNNSAQGANALYSNTTGSYNSALGDAAGGYTVNYTNTNNFNSTSTKSLYLGYLTKALASGDTNETVIGYGATGIGSNSIVLGNDSVATTILKGNVGIGTSTPTAKLGIQGGIGVSPNQLYLASNGYVGIGTTTATKNLVVAGADTKVMVTGTNGASIFLQKTGTSNGWSEWQQTGDRTRLNVNGSGDVVTILNTGNVGISTSTPTQKLVVNGGIQAKSGLPGGSNVNGTGYSFIAPGDTDGGMFSTADGTLKFLTNSVTAMTIDPSQNVGIGSAPTSAVKLQVNGDIRVGTSGTNGCVQNYAGTALTGTCSSDARLKDVVGNTTGILGKLSALQLVNYYWNNTANTVYHDATTTLNTGFVAQSVEKVFPNLVTTDSKGYKRLDYTTLGLYGLEATKELNNGFTLHNLASDATSTIASWYTGTTTPAISIDATGNIGIGTSTPYSRLTVWGSDTSATTTAFLVANSASTTEFQVNDNGNAFLAGSLSQNSDRRLKTKIEPLSATSSLAKITGLTPVNFNWKDQSKSSVTQLGFIAQDVQQIFPNIVSTTSATSLTPNGTLSLNYIGLISPIVASIKDLATQVSNFAQSITTKVITATTGRFTSISSKNISTNKLCIGDTCVNEAQLKALLKKSGQTGTALVVQIGSGSGSSNNSNDSNKNNNDATNIGTSTFSNTPDRASSSPRKGIVSTSTPKMATSTTPAIILGCTDSTATNYKKDATKNNKDDSKCTYPNTPPTITLSTTSTTITAGGTFDSLSFATANDKEDGNITPDITTSSTVSTSTPGTYKVVYNVSDSQGLSSATKILTVIVKLKPVTPIIKNQTAASKNEKTLLPVKIQ